MSRINSFLAPNLISAVLGASLAGVALVMQNGWVRGYATVTFLFMSAGLAALCGIVGFVTLSLNKTHVGLGLISSAVIFPTIYLLVLFAVGSVNGEY
jgi:hypothetical protein